MNHPNEMPERRSPRRPRRGPERFRRALNRRNGLIAGLAGATALLALPQVFEASLEDLPAAIVNAPVAVAEIPAQAAAGAMLVASGRHLGFDTHTYPGAKVMAAWKEQAPYEWVGYYLPGAPCHQSTSWAGTRETLEEQGWGTAVIYVGQQTWDGLPQPPAAVVERNRKNGTLKCHRSLLTSSRGRAEARDAIDRTQAEGFARGTVIYLDIEYMERTPDNMRAYYREWVREVLRDGQYRPGIYVHTRNAKVVYGDVKDEFAAAGFAEEPAFWIASGRNFTKEKSPQDSGHEFAAVWQGVLDVWERWNGYRLPIDVNVAAVNNPSSPHYVPQPRFASGD